MCNINILFKSPLSIEDNSARVKNFLFAVSSASYSGNNDGDGIFIKNDVIKDFIKLDYEEIPQELFKENVFITHQRLATCGETFQSLQPFYNDGFVFVHNGVIYSMGNKEKSDSLEFFEKFLIKFNEKKSKYDRNKLIVKLLKSMFEDISGSYSIGLFDTVTNIFYYGKNSRTNIHFYKCGEYVFISTESSNAHLLSLLSDSKIKEYNIEDDVLYMFTLENMQLRKKGKIDNKVWVWKEDNKKTQETTRTETVIITDTEKTQETTRDYYNAVPSFERKHRATCNYCSIPINDGETVCKFCLGEGYR